MASQAFTSSQPPSLSSCITAAQEWLNEDYAASVVWLVLDAREQIPAEIKRSLDTAIRNNSVKVPGAGFQLQDVQDAPTHHLHTPIFRKMQTSDELTEAVLRAWVAINAELYESVVQHLQWNDEPTYGPDRKEHTFRGYWDARDWQSNFNQFLADRTGFDRNDVGLMLWYVSGKLPPPVVEETDLTDRVDFEQWKESLKALSPDAPQWESALEFAESIYDIVVEKETQRAKNAVNQLKTRLEDIWMEYADELIYLEKDLGMWGSGSRIQPEVALQTLADVLSLESLLSQYRPIRDQAQSRSVESSRAGRRADLEADIIATVNKLRPALAPPSGIGPFDLRPEEGSAPIEAEVHIPAPTGELLTVVPEEPEIDGLCEELEAVDILALEETALPDEDALPEDLLPADESPSLTLVDDDLPVASEIPEAPTPATDAPATDAPVADLPPAQDYSEQDVNASILAGLQSLRADLEQLKARLVTSDDEGGEEAQYLTPETHLPSPEDRPAASVEGVGAAVQEAQERFPRQLMFRLNTESWVNGNPYDDSQAVVDALEWLATTYVPARLGNMDFDTLNDSLYKACRWKYSNSQQDPDFFRTEGQYRMLVNGKAYYLNETIGRGAGHDPVNTIRIAFYWDRHRERVVIGYIGQHQLTSGV